MSELIDKVYDVEKISAEVLEVLKEIGKTTAAIDGFKKSIEDLEKTTRKSKSSEDLIAGTKALNDTVIKGGVEMKRYEAEVQKLKEKTEQLTVSEKAAAIEIAKARLELQAAQKATKDAAIKAIELDAANKPLIQNYINLEKELKKNQRAFKELEISEQNSAKGRELLKKITETQEVLKKSDAAMGNYQRNVGNYASALEGLTPRIGGLAGTLLDIAKAAKQNQKDWEGMSDANNLGIQSMGAAPAGLAKITAGFKGLGTMIGTVAKAILANPIGFVVAGIVGLFTTLKAALDSNGKATEKLGQLMAPLKQIMGEVLNVLGKMVGVWIDAYLAVGEFVNKIMTYIPVLDKVAAKNREAIALEKEKQRLVREGIVDKAYDAKEELRLAELRKQIMEKTKYSAEERLAMARDIDKSEKALAKDDAKRANDNLIRFLKDMKLKGKTQKDYTIEELQQLTDLQTAKYSEQQSYFDKTKKLASRESSLIEELAAEKKEDAEKQKALNEKILESSRRLTDSKLALMKDSLEKDLAISAENLKRQLEDLQKNGELTKELRKNLEKAQEQEVTKIKDEWAEKQKEQAQKTADDLLAIELKRIEDTQKLIEKEIQEYKLIYDQKAAELKTQYSKGLISEKEYQEKLAQLKIDSELEANNKTIASLEKLLTDSKLTEDKRAELSSKLAQLKIDNENAAADAAIAANEKVLKDDEEKSKKRMEIAQALGELAGQAFEAISNYAIQQSEQKIAALEAEQEASDAAFEKEQENLDGALMSDENRKIKQQELNDKKAAADKALADKIQAEKIKQAKWDKANAIVQTLIQTGFAVAKSIAESPITFGLPWSAFAAAQGAIQVAAIASQPIPAFEKGGITGDGLALWGEARPEVAVTPQGDVMLASTPTITDFDAGTRIYKSVSDYEAAMQKKNGKAFEFDYDKLAAAIPSNQFEFDGNGLLVARDKRGNRRKMINRKYTL